MLSPLRSRVLEGPRSRWLSAKGAGRLIDWVTGSGGDVHASVNMKSGNKGLELVAATTIRRGGNSVPVLCIGSRTHSCPSMPTRRSPSSKPVDPSDLAASSICSLILHAPRRANQSAKEPAAHLPQSLVASRHARYSASHSAVGRISHGKMHDGGCVRQVYSERCRTVYGRQN
jgi:hypothetical protein